MGRSFCMSAPIGAWYTNWNKLPAKLRCEINNKMLRRKEKLFLLQLILILFYIYLSKLFKSTCYIYLFSFVSFLSHTVE